MMKVKVSFDTWLQLLGMLGLLGGLVALVIDSRENDEALVDRLFETLAGRESKSHIALGNKDLRGKFDALDALWLHYSAPILAGKWQESLPQVSTA